ncbi:MAG: alpha-ketoglutarate-dependent dioxygenase AlkB family protein [Flavobacteriales bacterium]
MEVVPEILLREGESALVVYRNCFAGYGINELSGRVIWQQNKIRLFGKEYDEPRLTSWYGPAYSYSGIKWPAQPMPDFLLEISDEIKGLYKVDFNSVLLNYYRNGSDSMGWHSDNEPEMDTHCIASVSLGASRVFALRRGKSGKSLRTMLHHGDLLVMINLQELWQHCVPKSSGSNDPRMNMTFRRIKAALTK